MSGYAIEIDDTYDAILMRDLLSKAAQEHLNRANKATLGKARKDNFHRHEVFAKYALRCEHIRKEEVERISAQLR